jgi:hypothetical protein
MMRQAKGFMPDGEVPWRPMRLERSGRFAHARHFWFKTSCFSLQAIRNKSLLQDDDRHFVCEPHGGMNATEQRPLQPTFAP